MIISNEFYNSWKMPPKAATEILQSTIRSNGRMRKYLEGSVVKAEDIKGKIISVESGNLILKLDDGFVVAHANNGFIIGSLELYSIYSISVMESAIIYECESDVINLSDENEISNAAHKYLTWVMSCLSVRMYILASTDAYLKIKFTLEWLNYSPAIYKESITLIKFICDRTRLSKAHVHMVLKQLKEGGYIEVNNGYLIEIVKKIPDKF
ncbi:helix-turn-helix domain-containing protein [Iodobacter fluviatilis]|uniref:IprA winged helix-turn-helix domain-containing protein n=1 Tax=Iodobacter fluviatilis TaxID=537 RepID=A0A7G3GA68_9NEIS|nr:helix-turn-helix domain-containing protein [Iodobacter fluviatilis]QBC44058.1 hypothetical protein C1H71_11305 [Iodobacter fluviatilis]